MFLSATLWRQGLKYQAIKRSFSPLFSHNAENHAKLTTVTHTNDSTSDSTSTTWSPEFSHKKLQAPPSRKNSKDHLVGLLFGDHEAAGQGHSKPGEQISWV